MTSSALLFGGCAILEGVEDLDNQSLTQARDREHRPVRDEEPFLEEAPPVCEEILPENLRKQPAK